METPGVIAPFGAIIRLRRVPMTLIRLCAAALVVCSTLAFAQTKTDSVAVSDQASASQPATAASSEPWKFIPNQPSDVAASKDPLSRFQVDQYKLLRSNGACIGLCPRAAADAGMVLSGFGGELDANTCLKIRSYGPQVREARWPRRRRARSHRARFQGFRFNAPGQLFDLPAFDPLSREDH